MICPFKTLFAYVPSAKIFPDNFNIALIVEFITKNEIPAESTATAFSFFAIPNATANAKINGKFPKIVLPTCDMIVKSAFRIVPSPKIPCK